MMNQHNSRMRFLFPVVLLLLPCCVCAHLHILGMRYENDTWMSVAIGTWNQDDSKLSFSNASLIPVVSKNTCVAVSPFFLQTKDEAYFLPINQTHYQILGWNGV